MKSNYKRLGDYIHKVDERNKYNNTNLQGLSMTKEYRPSTSNIVGTDLSTYKVMRKNRFVCDFMSVIRVYKLPVVLHKSDDIAIVSPAYTTFEVNDCKKLLPEYLMLWFRRSEFDRYAFFKCDSAIRGGFDWEALCDCMLPIPPIEQQQKIIDSYNTIENRISILRKINDNLADQLTTLLAKLFDDNNVSFDNLPNGWIATSIGRYCDVKSGYAFKSDWWQEEGVKVIKIANIKNLTINFNDCSYVSAENAQKAFQFSVVPGDILIAMTGATTGKFGIVPYTDSVPRVNQRVGKFFLGSDPLKKAPFLFATLLQKEVIKQLQPDGETGSAQDNLSPDDIKNIPIIYPSTEIVDSFNTQNTAILKQMMFNFTEINTLNNTLSVFLQTLSSI